MFDVLMFDVGAAAVSNICHDLTWRKTTFPNILITIVHDTFYP